MGLERRTSLALAAAGLAALVAVVWWGVRGPVEVPAPAGPLRFDPASLERGLWVWGDPLLPDSVKDRAVLEATFTAGDPRTAPFLERLDEWHTSYAPLGVRIFVRDQSRFAALAETSAVSRHARRLGLHLPVAAGGRSPGMRAPEFALYASDGVAIARGAGLAALARAEPLLQDLLAGGTGVREGETRGYPRFDDEGRVSAREVVLVPRELRRGPLASAELGTPQTFTAQFRHQEEAALGIPAPVGRWTPTSEGLVAARAGAANFVAIRYHAGRAGVVASPPRAGPGRLWILRDERWLPAAALGEDARLDERGASYVDVDAPRLYQIARGGGEHVLKLSPDAVGLTLHALTFDDPAADAPRP